MFLGESLYFSESHPCLQTRQTRNLVTDYFNNYSTMLNQGVNEKTLDLKNCEIFLLMIRLKDFQIANDIGP